VPIKKSVELSLDGKGFAKRKVTTKLEGKNHKSGEETSEKEKRLQTEDKLDQFSANLGGIGLRRGIKGRFLKKQSEW